MVSYTHNKLDTSGFGKDCAEHDKQLYTTINQIQQAGITLREVREELTFRRFTYQHYSNPSGRVLQMKVFSSQHTACPDNGQRTTVPICFIFLLSNIRLIIAHQEPI